LWVLLGDRGSRWRCLLVWTWGTSSLLVGAHLLRRPAGQAWRAVGAFGAQPLDAAVVDLAACVLLACLAWAWLVLSATVLEAWRGVDPATRRPWHPPLAVRRVVLAACGVALASGVAAPAGADEGSSPHHQEGGGHRHGAALLTGLPLPDRAVAPPRRSPAPTRTVVVAPGDSLWSIAQRDLPPDAPDGEVVARWHAVYAANRRVIGPDPGLIEPGQRLHLPRKDRP
jgi:hypothetical protein